MNGAEQNGEEDATGHAHAAVAQQQLPPKFEPMDVRQRHLFTGLIGAGGGTFLTILSIFGIMQGEWLGLLMVIFGPLMFFPKAYNDLLFKRLILNNDGITFRKAGKMEFNADWSEVRKVESGELWAGSAKNGSLTSYFEVTADQFELVTEREKSLGEKVIDEIEDFGEVPEATDGFKWLRLTVYDFFDEETIRQAFRSIAAMKETYPRIEVDDKRKWLVYPKSENGEDEESMKGANADGSKKSDPEEWLKG